MAATVQSDSSQDSLDVADASGFRLGGDSEGYGMRSKGLPFDRAKILATVTSTETLHPSRTTQTKANSGRLEARAWLGFVWQSRIHVRECGDRIDLVPPDVASGNRPAGQVRGLERSRRGRKTNFTASIAETCSTACFRLILYNGVVRR